MANWWQQPPTKRYQTVAEGVTLVTGVPDVEKGNIYASPAGTPVNIPVPSRIEWESHEQVVLQTSDNVLDFLHVNPSLPSGTLVPAGTEFGAVSYIGSPGYPSSYTDPNAHMTYQESGNVFEFGVYDTVKRAASRENYVNGVDQPWDFTGISDPSNVTSLWRSGKLSTTYPTSTSTMGLSSIPWKWILIGLALFLVLRSIKH